MATHAATDSRRGRWRRFALSLATITVLVGTSVALADVASAGTPTLTTQARLEVWDNDIALFDLANLSGATNPTGLITFTVFGPNDDTCSGTAAFQSTYVVDGNGYYLSDDFHPTATGTYRWVAAYSGDAANAPAGPTPCAGSAAAVTVSGATPSIATWTAPAVIAGDPVLAHVHFRNSFNATGTISFTLFGPNDDTCTMTPAFTSTVPVSQGSKGVNYASHRFTPTVPGTYHWRATYSGDANNSPAGPTSCADPDGTVLVGRPGQVIPTIWDHASLTSSPCCTTTDTATLGSGANPTGTVTFTLFLSGERTCGGTPVFTSVVPVAGNGTYDSEPFNLTNSPVGIYRWTAAYSGDTNNVRVNSTCGNMVANGVPPPIPLVGAATTTVYPPEITPPNTTPPTTTAPSTTTTVAPPTTVVAPTTDTPATPLSQAILPLAAVQASPPAPGATLGGVAGQPEFGTSRDVGPTGSAAGTATSVRSGSLARTGMSISSYVRTALALLVGGLALAVTFSRRRQPTPRPSR